MTELNLDSMPTITKAPAKPKPEPAPAAAAPRQAMREQTDRSIRDVARAPEHMIRQRKGTINPFDVPEQIKARFAEAGWSIEWKSHTVHGQQDWGYENALSENGWEAITTAEIPGFMPKGYEGAIIRNGLMLMKRPAYLTAEAREEESRLARDNIIAQEAKLGQTPPGTMTRDHPKLANSVGRSFEPMDVPDDEG